VAEPALGGQALHRRINPPEAGKYDAAGIFVRGDRKKHKKP